MVALVQIAAVVIRVFSTLWFVYAAVYTTELPADIFGLIHYQMGNGSAPAATTNYYSIQEEIHITVILIKVLLFFSLGLIFLFFTRPLARLLTKGLEKLP